MNQKIKNEIQTFKGCIVKCSSPLALYSTQEMLLARWVSVDLITDSSVCTIMLKLCNYHYYLSTELLYRL